MFEHSISRNKRTKGSKVKTIFQVSLILAIAIWLLYQIKHSYYEKSEYSRTDDNKRSNENSAYLGRKGKAGSENVIIIDTHEPNFEPTYTKEGGGQADVVDWEKDTENLNKGHEKSQDMTNDSGGEKQQEKVNIEDDAADSHVNGGDEATNNGFSEVKEDVLHLPSQQDSLKQNEHGNGLDGSLEQNDVPKDNSLVQDFMLDGAKKDDGEATSSDEESIKSSDHQTEIGENTLQISEIGGKDGELSDDAIAGKGRPSKSLPEDSSSVEESRNDEIRERETVEFQAVDSSSEITSNNIVEDASTDPGSHNEPLTSGRTDASPTNTETFETNAFETQRDNTDESDTNEKRSVETANTDTKQDEELADSSISTEENNTTKTGNNDTGNMEAFESRLDNGSGSRTPEEESEVRSGNELVNLSLADDNNNMQRKEVEAQGDSVSVPNATSNSASEEKTDQNSTDRLPDISLGEGVDSAVTVDTKDIKAEELESQRTNASDAGTTDNTLAEAKTERASEDEISDSSQSDEQKNSEIATESGSSQSDEQNNSEIATESGSSQSDEQNNSEISTDKSPNTEANESQGDDSSVDQITNDNALGVAETDSSSNSQPKSELGSNEDEQAEQEGTKDSE